MCLNAGNIAIEEVATFEVNDFVVFLEDVLRRVLGVDTLDSLQVIGVLRKRVKIF